MSNPTNKDDNNNDDEFEGHPMIRHDSTASGVSLRHSIRFSHKVSPHMHNPCQAIGLIIFASLYTFLYGGGFFGWGPMQLLLEENGSFTWKCNAYNNVTTTNTTITNDDVSNIVCAEQTSSLLNIEFIGVLAVLGAPILGWIIDKYQVVTLVYFIIFLLFIAFTTFIYASQYPSENIDPLLYITFICFGIVAQSTSILSIEAGMTLYPFDEVNRLRVISLLSALFDAGSITYLGLWALAHTYNLPLTFIVYIYAGMAVISYVGGLYFWIVLTKNKSTAYTPIPDDINISINVKGEKQILTAVTGLEEDYDDAITTNGKSRNDDIKTSSSSSSTYIKVADRRPYYKQMLSEPYFLLCFFFSIHFMTNAYSLTTMRDFLAYLGDDEYYNRYLTIFTMLLPVGLTGIPFVDYIIRIYGYHAGFQCINFLALLQNAVKLFSTDLNVQIIGFVAFVYLRCFLFCITLSYVPVLVHANVNGKAVGIMLFVCGLVSFLNLPLANMAMQQYNGNFFIPNTIAAILILPCFLAAYRLGTFMKKEQLAS